MVLYKHCVNSHLILSAQNLFQLAIWIIGWITWQLYTFFNIL